MGLLTLSLAITLVNASNAYTCGMHKGKPLKCSAYEVCQKHYDSMNASTQDQCDVILGWDEGNELDQTVEGL